jgi:hypothetical protein
MIFEIRRMFCAVVSLVLLSVAWAQDPTQSPAADDDSGVTGYCPQTRALKGDPQQEFWFDGTIGDRPVRMYLYRVGSGVVGLFYYAERDWDPILLGGGWKDGAVNLSDETEDHPATGRLQGQVGKMSLGGTWTSQGERAEPVQLAVVEEPKCDGDGPWKRFDDPKWPVSFSYPATWRVRESSDSVARSLTLTCPDPEAMAYNNEVTIWESEGKPGAGVEGAQSGVVMCADGWRYGCKCSDDLEACHRAETSRQRDRTILNLDEHEWRVYCRGGGYVAQGDGEDRVVVLQDRWVEFAGAGGSSAIVDRLVNSARPPSSAKDGDAKPPSPQR